MAKYLEEVDYVGENDVVFFIKGQSRRLVEQFSSPYLAAKFVNKAKRSKRVELVSFPLTTR